MENKKLIYGVGINNANYTVSPIIKGKRKYCMFYRKWVAMLGRCYSADFHKKRPTYIGCTVAPDWHYFMNFRAWMMFQDWEGKELDKDILGNGKIYSPETCIFVDSKINSLLNNQEKNRGKQPQGVDLDKRYSLFRARCNVDRKSIYLGYFDTCEEAQESYKKFKSNHVKKIALKQKDVRLKNALLLKSKQILGES